MKKSGKMMSAIKRKLVVFVFFVYTATLLSFPSTLLASFEDVGAGARAVALGGAFTAVANDPYAMAYNPAGLALVRRQELVGSYGLLQTGLGGKSSINASYFAYAYPISYKAGNFGISWQQLSLADRYSERAIALGYGKWVSQRWIVGANVKHLNLSIEPPEGVTLRGGARRTDIQDPVFASGNSRSNISLDLGTLYRIRANYVLGFSLQNINEPNMAISDSGSDPVKRTVRGGLMYHEKTFGLMNEIVTRQFAASRDYTYTLGAEKFFGVGRKDNRVFLRGALSYGTRSYRQFSVGVGYKTEAINLDYSFVIPLGELSYGMAGGGHRISLSLRFGKTVVEPDYESRMQAALKAAKDAEEKLEAVEQEYQEMKEQMEKIRSNGSSKKSRKYEEEPVLSELGDKKAVMAQFGAAVDRYWKRKVSGAAITEKTAMLLKIKSDFSGTSVDLSLVENEIQELKSEVIKTEYELRDAWTYYQKIAVRGASVPDRIQILSQMIEKFARSGVNLNYVVQELRALQEQKR